jgi:hypothetical protein
LDFEDKGRCIEMFFHVFEIHNNASSSVDQLLIAKGLVMTCPMGLLTVARTISLGMATGTEQFGFLATTGTRLVEQLLDWL